LSFGLTRLGHKLTIYHTVVDIVVLKDFLLRTDAIFNTMYKIQ